MGERPTPVPAAEVFTAARERVTTVGRQTLPFVRSRRPLRPRVAEPSRADLSTAASCSGTRIRTRKRNIAVPLDHGSFADTVTELFNDEGAEATSKEQQLVRHRTNANLPSSLPLHPLQAIAAASAKFPAALGLRTSRAGLASGLSASPSG